MYSSLFDFGPVPIALNVPSEDYCLNNVKFEWTPTKQVLSLNNVFFGPVKPYSIITAGETEESTLLLYQQPGGVSADFFTISFVVELHYDNF